MMTLRGRVVSTILLLNASCGLAIAAEQELVKLNSDRSTILQSCLIARETYRIDDPSDRGAIRIHGDDLIVDFQGATLDGAAVGKEADAFSGKGIVIRGRNVTVKNATVRGYKVGIFAEDSPGLKLINCDVSRNFRQRLKSTMEREDLSDWIYGHENDANEWLRYGSGIYLLSCPNAHVERCRARNGQNGLCLVKSDRVRVVDNDFSFLSGWGLAMWRSSECEVFNNKFDWCIRGYSHGVYSRGQDSTGILVYEQCHKNLFAYNSATHGGDGFFLYAGNETLQRTGRGGCNGNIVYQNDFSHAAANGIEATFSDGNVFLENILDECDHGVWAGYSYNTTIEKNTIRSSRNGISIEHGSSNRIVANEIRGAQVGVHLWWDDDKDLLASEFCKLHGGCRSTQNLVVANSILDSEVGVRLVDDTGSYVVDNNTSPKSTPLELRGNVDGTQLRLWPEQAPRFKFEGEGVISQVDDADPAIAISLTEPRMLDERLFTRKGEQDAFLPKGARRGRDQIFVDEWGPYDFSDARLIPRRVVAGHQATLQLLGEKGRFRVANVRGDVKVEPTEGDVPARLAVGASHDGLVSFSLEVEAGDAKLVAEGVLFRANWDVRFFPWTSIENVIGDESVWTKIIQREPLDTLAVPAIDFVWGMKSPSPKVTKDQFATVAEATVSLPVGAYRLQTISDDGVRVFIDGKRVISNWTHHGPTEDTTELTLAEGEHRIRIEHFEINGYAQLQFRITPK